MNHDLKTLDKTLDLKKQLARLSAMTASQLRREYQQMFGEPSRSGNRAFLFKRVAWRLQSQAEGGLSERAKQRAVELARDADLRLTVPKMRAAPDLPPAHVHVAGFTRDDAMPPPGSVLTRTYRGRSIVVTVLPKGYEYEGTIYRSLSAVAKAVTGSHWNGRLFFGLGKGGSK